MKWNVMQECGQIRAVLHWPEAHLPDTFSYVRGGNPILFPFSGHSFVDGDLGYWHSPDGTRRSMPIHGIARQGRFAVIDSHGHGFTALFKPDAQARECYPFSYEFTVTYHFAALGLSCEYVLKNTDCQPIPWSAGHHFYLTLPWDQNQQRGDYRLQLDASRVCRQGTNGHLISSPLFQPEKSFGDPELSNSIHFGLSSNIASVRSVMDGSSLSIQNGVDPTPHPEVGFVLWTPDMQVPFYCVEPWMGPPNAAETKVGLHWVPPGQSRSHVVKVTLAGDGQ